MPPVSAPSPSGARRTPCWARRWGENVQWGMKAWSGNRRRGDLPMTSFKSTPPSLEGMSLCTCNDATMIDECKQSTTTSSTHMKKNFQMNAFHAGLKLWMDLYLHCAFPGSYLKYALSLSKVKYDNRIKNPRGDRDLYNLHNYLWVVILQRTAFQWWCHGNRVSYWQRREFPNYARLHRGRIAYLL